MKKLYFSIIIGLLLIVTSQNISFASSHYYRKPIKIGGDNNYPPYEFVDNSGNFRGFNVDIIRAISIELGIEFELIPNDWDEIKHMLSTGEIDALQGMAVSPIYNGEFDFTDEIIRNTLNIFILQQTSNISTIKDLRYRKVAILDKDLSNELVFYIPGITIFEVETQMEAMNMLLSGDVDAYIGNRLAGFYYIQNYNLTETIKVVGGPLETIKYSIAVRSDNKDLMLLLNSGLKAIKENGTYDKVYKKWFGESVVELSVKWRNLMYAISIALMVSLGIIFITNYWNQSLKKEVDSRTKEVIELNSIVMHNDKMQALGELSAGIAHELRNPLTSIKAFVDLLPLKYEDSGFRDEIIKIVPKEINRLNDLVSSLLDYAKPNIPNPKKIRLDEILYEILTLLNQKFKEKNIKVITDNINIYFYADKSQMKQILINIILNSIDAIESNGIIRIIGKTSNSRVTISISDNGIGIPKNMINHLFDPFFSSKKTSYGIGLSVTYRLIKENRGEITVNSEVNMGTTITINLPKGPIVKEDENA